MSLAIYMLVRFSQDENGSWIALVLRGDYIVIYPSLSLCAAKRRFCCVSAIKH